MSVHWICSQLGAREKYAIPRAIRRRGNLAQLYTDVWVRPGSLIANVNRRLTGRFHPDLHDVPVTHFTRRLLTSRVVEKFTGSAAPAGGIYDRCVQQALTRKPRQGQTIFFGYSYASRLSMGAAKKLGYKTVLGQINPGPGEAEIVVEAFRQYRNGVHKPTVPDQAYWDLWHEEIDNSDTIMVNSTWSLRLLSRAGIEAGKCVVIPLAYEPGTTPPARRFPSRFDFASPLRLLYLGGIGIRKGFHLLVDAMKELTAHPVRLDVVGPLKGPAELIRDLPDNIVLHGAVPGSEVDRYYQAADIFMFPTLSDGFGLTQLEAQFYKLPIITSQCCAEVITDGVNGIVLERVDAVTIRDAVLKILDEPALIEKFSSQAVSMDDYSIEKLSQRLAGIEE
ncbi:MAG TPA: glycosyltransferase family 4 protein [Cyclobacteriaceae bacterium]|nr:glycosyltransferase family 4 protein [Cyclobacteriaceae bacterium]